VTTFLLDVNVLLALSLPTHQHHGGAARWFSTARSWATTALTETAYLRLMTNPRLVGYEIAPAQVIDALRSIRSLPAHRFIEDSASLADPTIDVQLLAGSSQVTDFHLVNVAARSSVVLATFDASLVRALHPDDRRHVQVLDD
jgi:toxin-antitoxin system PIN domain toxin